MSREGGKLSANEYHFDRARPGPVGSSRCGVGRVSARLLMATSTSTETDRPLAIHSLPPNLCSPTFELSVHPPYLWCSSLRLIALDHFRPRHDPPHIPGSFNLTKRSMIGFVSTLQGGLGGLAIGYSFGRMFICSLCIKWLRVSQSICLRSWHWSFPMKRLLRH